MAGQMILAVDDEVNIQELIRFNLESAGYRVEVAGSGEEALQKAAFEAPDLVLLDIMLPGMDGLEVCRRLRQNPRTQSIPVIMLTAKGEEVDKVVGLEMGADDYIVKPFGVRELTARVKAMFRRWDRPAQEEGEAGKRRTIGCLKIHEDTYEAFRGDAKLQLTLKEFELLKFLSANPGKVFSREQLLDRIWGYEYCGETRTVDVHIRHLRQKLEDPDGQTYIQTLRGVGYKWVYKG
ncbi:response regulator [Gehongia tenuis]|uniref:Stage 0 sporulation protein A homolog n=1 Tax=Gehongia tenuis TaxID=2763655 RepID=A0A926D3N8_9FIRM|nr:response regulator transcription factor [Gehongia tenuis]MBC8530874.1 response regulator transcription factor [Gehongia tenuis]